MELTHILSAVGEVATRALAYSCMVVVMVYGLPFNLRERHYAHRTIAM